VGECFDNSPESNRCEPINVIYQTAEDGLADTVKPRLVTAGADCTRILVIDDTEKSLSMQDARLEQAIVQTNAKMLILDPIQAYLGENVDINRANETREVTKKLSALAERTGCAIILIGHMNKSSMSKAAYRGIGSIDFFALARSVLLVARVPDQSNIRAVAQIKNNLAVEGEIVAFRLDENGFEWIGAYDVSVDELLGGVASGNKGEQAKEFLKQLLAGGKTASANDIIQKAKALGISKRTMENVKMELGIKSVRVGTAWHWKLG